MQNKHAVLLLILSETLELLWEKVGTSSMQCCNRSVHQTTSIGHAGNCIVNIILTLILCFENLLKFMIMYLCSAQNSCKFGYCYSSTATVHLNMPTNTPNFNSACRVLVVTITNLCNLFTLVTLSLRRLLHLCASVIVRNSHQFIPCCQQVHWPSGILTLELVLFQSTWMVLIAADMRATSLNVNAILLLAVPLICTLE